MVNNYTKKPVTIEAIEYTGDDSVAEIIEWGGPLKIGVQGGSLAIVTLEGIMRAEVGDFIIKGVNGEFYPCKPDIFAKTYQDAGLKEWYIWSIEHSAWWRASHNGYTEDFAEAGLYTYEEALKIVKGANMFGAKNEPNEAMIKKN